MAPDSVGMHNSCIWFRLARANGIPVRPSIFSSSYVSILFLFQIVLHVMIGVMLALSLIFFSSPSPLQQQIAISFLNRYVRISRLSVGVCGYTGFFYYEIDWVMLCLADSLYNLILGNEMHMALYERLHGCPGC